MNTAKQFYINMINDMPDDLGKQELLQRLYVEARLEQSREDFKNNGGISSAEVRRTMREKHSAMIRKNV